MAAVAMNTEEMMAVLLQQARVCLAQGQPSRALNLVLAAVRQQRGESGVFQVLNETREAHGLARLPVPTELFGAQLAEGGTHGAPRIQQGQQPQAGVRRRIAQQDEHMMDEDEEAAEQAGYGYAPHAPQQPPFNDEFAATAGLDHMDPADAVEALFRSLHVQNQAPSAHAAAAGPSMIAAATPAPTPHSHFHPAAATASAAPGHSPFGAWGAQAPSAAASHLHPHSHAHAHSHPFGRGPGGGGAGGGSGGMDGYARNNNASYQQQQDPSASSSARSVTYPSLRTVLPAMTASVHSTTRLELVHEPAWAGATAAAAAAGSASPSATACDPSAAAPLLSLAGRDALLESAYDDANNVICPRCAALIPKARFQAHTLYWCQ